MLLVEIHQSLRLFLLIFLMDFLDLFDLRLDPLHDHLVFRTLMEKRVEDQTNKQRDLDDRKAKILKGYRFIEKNEGVEDRIFKNEMVDVDKIVHSVLFQHLGGFLEFSFKICLGDLFYLGIEHHQN